MKHQVSSGWTHIMLEEGGGFSLSVYTGETITVNKKPSNVHLSMCVLFQHRLEALHDLTQQISLCAMHNISDSPYAVHSVLSTCLKLAMTIHKSLLCTIKESEKFVAYFYFSKPFWYLWVSQYCKTSKIQHSLTIIQRDMGDNSEF